jgi:hypothetical protein
MPKVADQTSPLNSPPRIASMHLISSLDIWH